MTPIVNAIVKIRDRNLEKESKQERKQERSPERVMGQSGHGPPSRTRPILRSTSRSARLTLSIAEAAELIGISRTTAYELAQSGELPTVRLGRRILVPVNQLADTLGTDVDAVLDALRSRPAS